MPDSDDISLLRAFCATRDERAFTALVRRHLGLVHAVALRRLDSRVLAEEAAQNVFTILAGKAESVKRHPERLRAWLHRATLLECRNILRKETRQARLVARSIADSDTAQADATEAMHRPEIYDRLDDALDALSERDREMVLRRYCGGEDFRTIAAAMGGSDDACQKRVARAVEKLCSLLGPKSAATLTVTALTTALRLDAAAALPSPAGIAQAAMARSASGAAGILSGTTLAACAVAVAAGIGLTFLPEGRVPSPPAVVPPAPVVAASAPPSLVPPAARANRELTEVLVSLDSFRLAPLVDFLPRATPGEIRTLLEQQENLHGAAVSLLARRWAETDPAAALDWFLAQPNAGGPSARVLRQWLAQDAAAALGRLAALPQGLREELVIQLAGIDIPAADSVARAQPDLFWHVASTRHDRERKGITAEDALTLIESAIAGDADPMPGDYELAEAFRKAATAAPERAMELARQVTQEDLRAVVLQALHSARFQRPVASSTEVEEMMAGLPPGNERAILAGKFSELLVQENAEAAIRRVTSAPPGIERDAMLGAVARYLSRTDPRRCLDIVCALRGPLTDPDLAIAQFLRTGGSSRSSSSPWSQTNFSSAAALNDAIARVAGEDPRAAMESVLRLAEGPLSGKPVAALLQPLLSGWTLRDFPGAMAWIEKCGVPEIQNDAGNMVMNLPISEEKFLELLPAVSGAGREILLRRLPSLLDARIQRGEAEILTAKLPAADVDAALLSRLYGSMARDCWNESLCPAALASPEGRRSSLFPEIASRWLRKEPESALAWLRSLPATERQPAVDSALRSWPAPDDKILTALHSLVP